MIKDVKVIEGCISCRNCETVAPTTFKVAPKSKVISDSFEGNEAEILQAELMCPVNVIKVNKKGGFTLSFNEAVVQKKKFLTSDILELTFSASNFSFKPGQYISLQMNDWKGKFSRSYSIASYNSGMFTLTVKLLSKGRGARFLSCLKIGKKINYLGALGNFHLKNTPVKKTLIATGTGLAPMISMLQNMPEKVEKKVIYGVRFEKDVYYKEILEKFANTHVTIQVSQPGNDFTGNKGRVTDCLDEISSDSEVYICGNPNMVESVKKGLLERGHSENLIFNESFTVSTNHPSLGRDIFINGNIPGINIFSWLVIIIGLFVIPSLWYSHVVNNALYADFLFFGTFMSFLWDLSWWSVVFVMGIRPLSHLFPKIGLLRKLTSLRKAFGILSSSIIITVLLGNFILDSSNFVKYFSSTKWELYYPIIGRVSEITGLILLLTSNNISQRKLGIWWKRIQRSSYLYFISGGIIAAQYAPLKIYPAMGVVIFLWVLSEGVTRFGRN
ncbi:hypothetical protein A9Q91_01225 [Candidatus Gracilibacteria bacterium 28_42_T64]|nr:hypothetical protein A9Q91_01225 [Candidatus Gracilibacteria bacterium 28_42_T64]